MTEDVKSKEFEFETDGAAVEDGPGRPIAYIRSVSKQELEAALPPDAPDGPYFALHDEEGRPLAVFSDVLSARMAAKAHNYETVSVH